MLAYKHRFHGHNSLRFVYKNSKPIRSQYITIRSVTNPKRKHSRFAVVVSKKVMKSAVGRNRIRRRLYEVVRNNLDNITPGHDVILLVSSAELRTMPSDELSKTVQKLLAESNLYKTPL